MNEMVGVAVFLIGGAGMIVTGAAGSSAGFLVSVVVAACGVALSWKRY